MAENIVTPVKLAKELGVQPQLVFSWVRKGTIPSHKCVCGHTYLQRDELSEFLEKRAKKAEEKKAQIEAELQGQRQKAAV